MYEQKQSVDVYVDGQLSTPEEAQRLCESQSYMADYVVDDMGYLCEIRYDRVDLQNF